MICFLRAGETETKDESFDTSKKYKTIEYSKTINGNTDIKITPKSNGVKEDIVLKQKPSETEFSYELDVKNYDSSEEEKESYEIEVKLEKTGDNTYKYTLIPDKIFIEDVNTVYPVVIDPAVETLSGGAIDDTFISSRYSKNNYSGDEHIKIGYSSTFYKSRGLIKITNWPSQLTGNTILTGAYHAYQDYDGASSPTMEAHKITENWTATTVKWSNQPDYSSTIEYERIVDDIEWNYWDITTLARGWFNGTISNYGILLKNDNESLNMYKRFCSEEHCILIFQTYDLNQMDRIHKIVFEDKSRLIDLSYRYPERENEYPVYKFGDGIIYLEHNTLQDEYYLKSTIIDGKPFDFGHTERMTIGLPVNYIRKIKIEAPYIYLLDCNNCRIIVNYATYECIYNEYIDKNIMIINLSIFNDISTFQPVESIFEKVK